jgi:hypothetical protein
MLAQNKKLLTETEAELKKSDNELMKKLASLCGDDDLENEDIDQKIVDTLAK